MKQRKTLSRGRTRWRMRTSPGSHPFNTSDNLNDSLGSPTLFASDQTRPSPQDPLTKQKRYNTITAAKAKSPTPTMYGSLVNDGLPGKQQKNSFSSQAEKAKTQCRTQIGASRRNRNATIKIPRVQEQGANYDRIQYAEGDGERRSTSPEKTHSKAKLAPAAPTSVGCRQIISVRRTKGWDTAK